MDVTRDNLKGLQSRIPETRPSSGLFEGCHRNSREQQLPALALGDVGTDRDGPAV